MEFKCNICSKNFQTEESLKQHNLSKHTDGGHKKINFKRYFILFGIFLTILFLSLAVYANSKKAGEYDKFAKCLTEKGAVIYGNDFCSYTVKQLGYFGRSKQYLNYTKCAENEKLCNDKNVKITPTWEIDGKTYEQVQTFEKLSLLSGCTL